MFLPLIEFRIVNSYISYYIYVEFLMCNFEMLSQYT